VYRNFSPSRVRGPASHNTFMQARARARKGSILADVLFAETPVLPELESSHEQSENTQKFAVKWFKVSPLTMLEVGAHVAAMFDEPDGTRLVRAVIATLEQLGVTTSEEIGQAIQARLPELFAIPLAYPYDDICVLLKEYMGLAGETREIQKTDGSDSSASDDSARVETCECCGHEWSITIARDWLHFESFVCGLGCPACRADFRDRAVYPGDRDL
jgi:hypothetical protein